MARGAKRLARFGLGSLAVTTVAALAAASGSLAASSSKVAQATADAAGVRVTYSVPDFLIVSEYVDGGGPVTSATVDAVGQSVGTASFPYPGETAIGLPAVLSVVLQRSVPLSYPFHVRAEHPNTPVAELGDPTGTYQVTARVSGNEATGIAAMEAGEGMSGSRSSTHVTVDDAGKTVASAESVDTGISVGDGLLRIGSVVSRAESVLGPDDERPVNTTELVIEGASVAGQPVRIGEDGIEGSAAATELLEEAGISITIREGTSGSDGPAKADLLIVKFRHPMPGLEGREAIFELWFGAARAEIFLQPEEEELAEIEEAFNAPRGAAPAGPPASEPAPPNPSSAPQRRVSGGEGPSPSAGGFAPATGDRAWSGEIPELDEEPGTASPIGSENAGRGGEDRLATQVVKVQPSRPASTWSTDASVTGPYLVLLVGAVVLVSSTRLRRFRGGN